MGWPLTNGSFDRDISLGVKSVDDALREPPLSAAARAFALGFIAFLTSAGAVGDGRPEPAPESLRSEAVDRVLPPMGTVRFLRFCADVDSPGSGRTTNSGSGGASAAGTGSPRAAATS